MIIDKPQDVLPNVPLKQSPFCDERPDDSDISLLVIHNISLPDGHFGSNYVEQFFLGTLDCDEPSFQHLRGVRVSAHIFIDREGRISQFVPFSKRAWHAGVSNFEGVSNCNDFSIGIELEGTDTTPYTPPQYETLAKLTRDLMQMYPAITRERIVGHSAIAPGRKTDPGESFDWNQYYELL